MAITKQVKEQLRVLRFALRAKPMLYELSQVPIAESGVQIIEGRHVPFVILRNGRCLFGRAANSFERAIYRRWKSMIAKTVSEDTIRVAMDVILRYLYPHAMPQLTMPYSRRQRLCFHRQHRDTIRDLPDLSEREKEAILKVFDIKKGETFLDVGSYMGYGVVRIAEEIGGKSQILAVEADPEAQWYLKKNVEVNDLSNVAIIPKAVSNVQGSGQFFQTERQANSLISEVVASEKNMRVPVTTIDDIVREVGLASVNRISLTINGAELEAVEGMKNTVQASSHIRISLAGWYKRRGRRIADLVEPILRGYGLHVVIGRVGSVLAWKSD